MIETIYFDFGNVIAFFDHGLALQKLARFTSLETPRLKQVLYDAPIADAYERGEVTTRKFVEAALRDGQLLCSEDQFIACYQDIFWPNPEVLELLPKLSKQYRLILASNTNEAHAERFRRDFCDSLSYFQHLVLSFEAKARKPEKAFFEYANQFAQTEASRCLFIDDLSANVEAARQCGWRGIIYSKRSNLLDEFAAAGDTI